MPGSVIIIGGGAAGLAAASRLAAAGLRVILLEARDRLGGRIHTLHAGWPLPVEAGPEFLHGDAPEMQQAVDAARAITEELPDNHWRATAGKPRLTESEGVWADVYRRLQNYAGPDLTFDDFLTQQCGHLAPVARQQAIDYAEGFNAADANQLSVDWLRQTEAELGAGSDEGIRRLTSGYDGIVQTLLADSTQIDLRLQSRVKAVRWRAGAVDVCFSSPGGDEHVVTADCAIITLPLGVLQAEPLQGGIAFQPELPEKRRAASRLRMGAVVKAVLWFREPFWMKLGIDARGFLHLSGQSFGAWWPLGDSPLLTGWSGGRRAWNLSDQSDEAILATAIENLAQGLATSVQTVRAQLVKNEIFNWQRDPFSRGAYSYPAVGGAAAGQQLALPVENTLFFAGEATEVVYAATVSGAIRSGYRAADEVLARFEKTA